MGVVAIENRINKLHSLEAQIEALEAEANAIRSEIKAAMDEFDEMKKNPEGYKKYECIKDAAADVLKAK